MAFVGNLRQFMSGTRKDASSKPPVLLSWRSSKFFIVTTVCLALFTDIFYYALIVPVIPFSLTVQVGIAEDQVQSWTSILLACYSAALFVSSPLAGIYADHSSSRRWPLLLGLLALAASTLLLCFGNSIGLLVFGRLLQGLSAGIVWSVGCALLVDTMEDAVGMAMGYVASSMSVALLIAPTVGGAVYAAAGYYAVYYIAFGVVLVDILLRLLMIEKKVAKQWLAPVAPDSTLNAETVVEKTAATGSQGASQEGHHAPADTRLISTQANMATGALPESVDQDDVLTRHNTGSQRSGLRSRPIWVLLKSPRLLAALYAILVQAGIMMGFDAVLALFVQSTFHWNSIAAGLMFIAIFLPGFISPLVGWLADKYGAKWLSFAGYVATIPPVICLRFVTEDTIGHKVLLAVLLAIIGVSLAFSNTPLMAEITYVIVEKAETNPGIFGEKGAFGIGYGLFTMAFAAGGVVGPLWAGYVNDSAGWGTAMWSLGVWAASGAVVVVVWLGSKSPQKKQDNRRQQQQQQQQQGDTEGGREATTPALV